MYKLICFDLDDTLWPCLPTIMSAEKIFYDWLCEHKSHITQKYSIEQLQQKRKDLLKQHPQLLADLSEARRVHLRQVADEFNESHDWIEAAFDIYYQARQKVSLYEDVMPVLSCLKSHFKLVALTNGNAQYRLTGLQDVFEFQVSAADVQAPKPDPAMFVRAMQQAGVSAQQTLHVGDHPVHDIQGAYNAGVTGVWINRTKQLWDIEQPQPAQSFTDLFQLQDWLVKSI